MSIIKHKLMEPAVLAGLRLKNRIVRAPVYEKLADENGTVTGGLRDLYSRLAQGGAGLIITGGALVHPSGRSLRRMLSAHGDTFNDGLASLAQAVHDSDGIIALQLFHGGPQCPPRALNWAEALGPVDGESSEGGRVRAMKEPEIWEAIEAFGAAAFRAQAAGFDALEIDASNGYLISSFLSPAVNMRDDYWGGDEERRAHMLEETLKAVRGTAGERFPVIVRLNAADNLPGGLMAEEAARIARRAVIAGADAIELSGGTRRSNPPVLRGASAAEGYYRAEASIIRNGLSAPVILTGGFRTLAAMEETLNAGDADMIGLGRPLVMEPGLPMNLAEGRGSGCTSCNGCAKFSRIESVRCTEAAGDS